MEKQSTIEIMKKFSKAQALDEKLGLLSCLNENAKSGEKLSIFEISNLALSPDPTIGDTATNMLKCYNKEDTVAYFTKAFAIQTVYLYAYGYNYRKNYSLKNRIADIFSFYSDLALPHISKCCDYLSQGSDNLLCAAYSNGLISSLKIKEEPASMLHVFGRGVDKNTFFCYCLAESKSWLKFFSDEIKLKGSQTRFSNHLKEKMQLLYLSYKPRSGWVQYNKQTGHVKLL